MKITFYGGAQTVTGANHLLETEHTRILVDCGLFQCPQFCSLENYEPFRYDPKTINALFVTHAHIDHIGRIPKLLREGFRGKIYSTHPTKDFASVMLEDSLGVLEKEARHSDKEVFYNEQDIQKALHAWEGVAYGERIDVGDYAVELLNAGHILGSSLIQVTYNDKKILFTGDLGNVPNPLLAPYKLPEGLTCLVIESTYGDRTHEDSKERKINLERAIEDTVHRGGVLMIPAFALERTQELLYHLDGLIENGRVPSVPVFMDSPLAIKATRIYKKYASYFNGEAQALIKKGDDLFQFPNLKFTLRTEESKHINDVPGPKIIIAGAGMMQGGRILYHAIRYLPDEKNMILFIGYLAANSTGRRIAEGTSSVRIFGEDVPVRAEVRQIGGYSAHADHDALMEFVESSKETLERVFVVQGEPASAMFLSQRIKDYLGLESTAPKLGDSVSL